MSKEITRIEGCLPGYDAIRIKNGGVGDFCPVAHMDMNSPKHVRATLFISPDSTPPRVFTEAEVKALYLDLYSAAMDGPYMPHTVRMNECLEKHGITL